MKRTIVLILAMLVLTCPLCFNYSFAETAQERYEVAQYLMIDGKYLEATDAFDTLLTYSDAAQISVKYQVIKIRID